MHKKIKYIVATALVMASVSGFMPVNNLGLGNNIAYASTYDNAKDGQLKSLDLTWSNGKNKIKLLESYSSDDEVELSDDKEYYVNLKGINSFNVSAKVKGSGYVVKVFTSSSKSEKGEDTGIDVDINSNYKDIYLRIYKSEDAYDEAYDSGDVSDCEKTYIIHVRKSTSESETEQDREYAYLDGIYLSNGYIDFSKNKTSYDVNVDENINKLTVRVTPDDDDDYIEINGISVYEDDDFEKTINLDKGNNTIKIYVEHEEGDDEEDATYTLNVYRGKVTNSSNTSNNQNITIQSNGSNFNTWKMVDGKWRYLDGTGEILKNQWWFDGKTGVNYYLKEDGYRATGWLYFGNNWYYFNENGEMQTGWVNINKNWYYLSKSGAMQMGWIEDSSGNWYYLNSSGAMQTGWVENSDGKWYYLDSTGKMTKDSAINEYKLGSDGALIQ